MALFAAEQVAHGGDSPLDGADVQVAEAQDEFRGLGGPAGAVADHAVRADQPLAQLGVCIGALDPNARS